MPSIAQNKTLLFLPVFLTRAELLCLPYYEIPCTSSNSTPVNARTAKEAIKCYDPEHLQKCLSDACLDLFESTNLSQILPIDIQNMTEEKVEMNQEAINNKLSLKRKSVENPKNVVAKFKKRQYDPEHLQRCLSDACIDWFDSRLGYPFHRLV